MSSTLNAAEREAIREASQWYAQIASGSHDEATHLAWQHWLTLSPLHQQAWLRIETVRNQFAQVPSSIAASSLHNPHHSRRQILRSFTGLAALGTLGAFSWRSDWGQSLSADYRTTVGEQRRFNLADGSALMLDTNSAVDVQFDAQQRRLLLRNGALWVSTAPDALHRPFVVDTIHGRVHALGTRFTVAQLNAEQSRVTVLEKAVEVHAAHSTLITRVEAGQNLCFSQQHLGTTQTNAESAAAWTHGSLIAVDQPLGEVIHELARYRHGWLRCDPRIAHLKISGAFPLKDTDLALSALTSSFPVRLMQHSRYWVTIVPSA